MSEASCVNIRRVRAREFLGDPKRLGGSKSVVIRGDDRAQYNVKFKENGQGLRVLVNEIIAAHIAVKLQVPTPETAIVEVERAFLDANPNLATRYSRPVTEGPHFGSMIERGAFENPPSALISTVTNKEDFPGVVTFDVLTNNTDRGNAGNFLIVPREGDPKQTRFLSVDHGHCFGCNWNQNLPGTVGSWSRSHLREIAETICGASPFDSAIGNLSKISPEWLDDLVSCVPDEWGISSEEGNALKAFILRQAEHVHEILEREHALFPNWK